MRGYAAIGLHRPKYLENVGGVLRAAGCFGAAMVAVSGRRYERQRTDVQKTWRHIPLLQRVEDLHAVIPYGAMPIALEVNGERCLSGFEHPTSAFYIFGPEDGSIPNSMLEWCRFHVRIPSSLCLNLAAAVNVVLYDRAAKIERRIKNGC
jgi:tRNA(Leu) C34 or U34 (ribose-2'-O)-methylase TrmL